MVGPLEGEAVGRRATEVDRQPGVALVDEVLGVAVPFVAVVGRRPAMWIDDSRHRIRGVCRPEEESLDLQPVG